MNEINHIQVDWCLCLLYKIQDKFEYYTTVSAILFH